MVTKWFPPFLAEFEAAKFLSKFQQLRPSKKVTIFAAFSDYSTPTLRLLVTKSRSPPRKQLLFTPISPGFLLNGDKKGISFVQRRINQNLGGLNGQNKTRQHS